MSAKGIKILVVAVLVVIASVAVFGYLSSGFTTSDLTVNPEGAVTGTDQVQLFEGWQLHYANTEIEGDGNVNADSSGGYDAIRAIFSYDEELLKKYEKQGYKVEVGAIFGTGMDLSTGVRYNTTDKLTVVEKDGVLSSATDRTDVYLFYSSDESVETSGWFDTWAYGDSTRVVARVEHTFDDVVTSQNPLGTTLIARGFVRLTSQSGSVKVLYKNAPEVMSVSPLVFGD